MLKHYYKTLGTRVINSPIFFPSLVKPKYVLYIVDNKETNIYTVIHTDTIIAKPLKIREKQGTMEDEESPSKNQHVTS